MNVCRIEDTDQARSTKESELEVMADLAWLGINWQEGAAATAATSLHKRKHTVAPIPQICSLATATAKA